MEVRLDRPPPRTANTVEAEAIRLRSSGLGPVVVAALLLFGGLVLEQPILLLVGVVAFLGAVLLRKVETRRALETMPLARGAAVRDEVERTAVRPNVPRSILLTVLAHAFVGICYRLGMR